MCAGVLADAVGIPFAFSFLGIGGVAVAVILFKVTPHTIRLTIKPH